MPAMKLALIAHDGTEHGFEAPAGVSLMAAATGFGVPGILADCGGACSCATCHCYVDDAWLAKTGTADDVETQMLEFVLDPQPNSRLSCQIVIDDTLDGLVVRLPASQI